MTTVKERMRFFQPLHERVQESQDDDDRHKIVVEIDGERFDFTSLQAMIDFFSEPEPEDETGPKILQKPTEGGSHPMFKRTTAGNKNSATESRILESQATRDFRRRLFGDRPWEDRTERVRALYR